jgi:hypothetical protein
MHMILITNLSDEPEIIGPFDSKPNAETWAKQNLSEFVAWHAVPVMSPAEALA